VGHLALVASTTGNGNTAVGALGVLGACTTGGVNSGFGVYALGGVTTGNTNTGCGYAAGYEITTGGNNLCLGNDSGRGGSPFQITTQSNRIVLGNSSITNAYIQVAWTVTSDARDKTNIQSVPHGLSFVNQLNPVSYQFKKNRESNIPHGNKRYGFLAQDILALEGDNPVIIDTEVPEKLKYQGEALVPVLVNAIKELSAQVTALQAEVNQLKGQ
jgi:hypothetical protein